jgi:excisionase family DNA binding protein
MITIPLNTNTGIRIPERIPPEKPEPKRTESIERLGASIQEAAKMLNIGKPLMSHLVKTGQIRAIKIGKRVVVSVQSLRDLVDGTKEPRNSAENTAELPEKTNKASTRKYVVDSMASFLCDPCVIFVSFVVKMNHKGHEDYTKNTKLMVDTFTFWRNPKQPQPPLAIRRRSGDIVSGNCVGCRTGKALFAGRNERQRICDSRIAEFKLEFA